MDKVIHRSAAFSLIELLVVMMIIAFLSVAAIPAMRSLLSGSRLSRAGEMVGDQIQLGRQEAVGKNREIRVLFYNFTNGVTKGWSAIQIQRIEQTDSNSVSYPSSRFLVFPEGVVISPSASLSPLLTIYTNTASTNLPNYGAAEVAEFRYRPNGSLSGNPSISNCFLTLQEATATGNPPANYYTIQVNPLVGKVTVFRP